MKKVLGIIASPRKGGNCEVMVKEISRQIPEPHELLLLRLQDFNILPCKGCYRCLTKKKKCILDDDLDMVMKAMVEADALVVTAPTYCQGANASLKRLLDRFFPFYTQIEALWGKPAVGVGIAGIKGKEGHTLLDIQTFLKFFLADIKECQIVYGALPGEIFLNNENYKTAGALAAALFGRPSIKKTPVCPLCGGDTFRFLGNHKVCCMLCSNSGTMNMAPEAPAFEIAESDHELFLTKEAVIEHRDWLVGMVERFGESKDQLKQITKSYSEGGTWIKP
jgi:multimeric flavodoxin WrbA